MYALSSGLRNFTLHTDGLLNHTIYSLAACNSAINGIQRIKLSQLCFESLARPRFAKLIRLSEFTLFS